MKRREGAARPRPVLGAAPLLKVTDHKRTEQALLDSEERLRLLIEGVREYAIFQLDSGGYIVSWNTGAQRLKGYQSEEILGKHFSVFYDLNEISEGRPEHNLEVAAREGECKDEGWRLRKDGSRFWASVVITSLKDEGGNVRGFVKITRDLTERRDREAFLQEAKETLERRVEQRAATLVKVNLELRQEIAERERVETELRKLLEQLRAVAGRLQLVREEERSLMAREMHDELGQACTAIKMDLASIGRKLTKKQAKLQAKVQSAMQVVDQMIFTVRRMASELRPRTLDDLGLTAALEWYTQEFQSRTGIHCTVAVPREPLNLDFDRSTAIFRIYQESLTNVARHSGATLVESRLEQHGDQLMLMVKDNGKGFDVRQTTGRRSLGLVGMQERALLLHGELTVQGVPGAGTTVTLWLPLPPAKPSGKEA